MQHQRRAAAHRRRVRSESGASPGSGCQEFLKHTSASADPGGTGRRGLMTATTAVQSGRSYMAHSLALVESNEIGEDTRIWAFAHVMKGACIGRGCNIGEHCYIEQGVTLGDNVTVKNGVNVWTGVTVEDNVFLGPNCVLTNDPNPR